MTDGFALRLPHGPGLRVAVKDLIDMEGLATTAGSPAVDAVPAARDAACLAGVRAAAVIVGRTVMHELAYGVTGVNPWQGTPINPIDTRLVPGGSSSGAAVVVANGETDVALGSDTGGSVRIPAACCGVAGLKTTWGRIPLDGVWPLAPSMDTIGPLARDVAGLVQGMQLLEPGFQPGAATTRIARLHLGAAAWVEESLDRILGPLPVLRLTGWEEASRACGLLLSHEAFQSVGHLLGTGRVGPGVAGRLAAGGRRTRSEVDAAMTVRRSWAARLEEAFTRFDVLALPTLRDVPPTLEEADRMYDLRLTLPVNLAGLPAVSLPVPRRGGPPASLQLIGRHGSEEQLLATAAALESHAQG